MLAKKRWPRNISQETRVQKMRGGWNERAPGENRNFAFMIAPALALLLAGCGSSSLSSSLSSLNIFDSNKATTGAAAEGAAAEPSDIECPGVKVRSGASTLMIGDNSK